MGYNSVTGIIGLSSFI